MHQFLACSSHDLRKGSGQDPFVRPHKIFPIGTYTGVVWMLLCGTVV